jgi:voltage-gated potassium channel
MHAHTVLIGYGDTGRVAADTFSADRPASRLVVVDTDPDRLWLVLEHGAAAVLGSGADLGVLRRAKVQDAACVIVAVANDAAAIRIIAAVRRVNGAVTIITLVRESRWRDLAECLGADQVVVVGQIISRLLGQSVRQPERHDPSSTANLSLVIAERAVRDAEIGRTPRECGALVLAVVRGGARVWIDDPDVQTLRPDDRLLVLRAVAPGEL